MALNLVSTPEIKSIQDYTKSNSTSLPKLFPGGFVLKRKDYGSTFGRRIQCSAQSPQPPPPAWPGRAFPESGRKTWDGPKPISIIGSNGSIGTQTLHIVTESPDKLRVVGLAAGSNVTLLTDQVKTLKPQLVAVRSESLIWIKSLRLFLGNKVLLSLQLLQAGKDIALANKETLIAGRPFVLPLAHKHNVKILPADSEHSAIFQDKVPLLSVKALHNLHIFIFVMVIVHVTFCVVAIFLGGLKREKAQEAKELERLRREGYVGDGGLACFHSPMAHGLIRSL